METKERSEFEVVANILRWAALGSRKKDIILGCNISRETVEKYLSAMTQLKLLGVEERKGRFYRTTGRGLELLRFYHGLRWLLWGREFDVLMLRITSRLRRDKKPYYVS